MWNLNPTLTLFVHHPIGSVCPHEFVQCPEDKDSDLD